MTLPAVLLHGFAGTGAAWDAVRAELGSGAEGVLAPDLPGHGSAGDERPVTFNGCVEAVLRAAPAQFVLGGYSMGGRIALHVALAAPERVRGLVLVSTTAGIESAAEREARRKADEALAKEAEQGSIEDFAAVWTAQSLFAGDHPDTREAWMQDITRNHPAGLAAALRGIGTGSMQPLWGRLDEITAPVRILTGERDAKFTAIGERMAAAFPHAGLTVVPGAGHALIREAPAAVAGALRGSAMA